MSYHTETYGTSTGTIPCPHCGKQPSWKNISTRRRDQKFRATCQCGSKEYDCPKWLAKLEWNAGE